MESAEAFEEIEYRAEGAIRVITLNRPRRMNAIGPRTARELSRAWRDFRDDPDALVAVMTGSGSEAFCAGADLHSVAAAIPGSDSDEEPLLDPSPAEREAHRRGEREGMIGPSRLTDIYKPIIAAINGVAYAGGLEWACFADIRIVEQHATFGVTCRRWNIGLGDGGTQRLPRIVGMGRAMELILTGRVIDAERALEIGLANEVVPTGRGLERALDLAGELASLPREAMRTDKEAAIRGYGLPLEDGLKIEAECFDRLLDTPAMAEGASRFVRRDHPDRDPAGGSVTPGIRRRGPST